MTSAEKAKDLRLRKIYKTTLAKQNEQLATQYNRCAICSRPFWPLHNSKGKTFTAYQDHAHACCPRRLKEYCGRCNRGLLCYVCNKYLVGIVEKLGLPVDKLLDYLEFWNEELKKKGAYAKTKRVRIPKKKKSL